MEKDHLEALGGSIESIALAKAGIFKPGGQAVMGHQPFASAAAVALEHASQIKCSVHTCQAMVLSREPIVRYAASVLDELATTSNTCQPQNMRRQSLAISRDSVMWYNMSQSCVGRLCVHLQWSYSASTGVGRKPDSNNGGTVVAITKRGTSRHLQFGKA
jgi:hypothetical protein